MVAPMGAPDYFQEEVKRLLTLSNYDRISAERRDHALLRGIEGLALAALDAIRTNPDETERIQRARALKAVLEDIADAFSARGSDRFPVLNDLLVIDLPRWAARPGEVPLPPAMAGRLASEPPISKEIEGFLREKGEEAIRARQVLVATRADVKEETARALRLARLALAVAAWGFVAGAAALALYAFGVAP